MEKKTISKLEKGAIFSTKTGKAEYKFIGKFDNEKGECYYLSAHSNSNGKNGFYTMNDIEVVEKDELPF